MVHMPEDQNSPQKKKRRAGIGVYLSGGILLIFLLMSGVITYISYESYKEAFHKYSSELCISSNAQAGYMIDGDLVERFADTLTADEEYRQFVAGLDQLKERISARYFYILTDKGIPGMYTYIYDATYNDEFPGEEFVLGRNETKEEYEGADVVLETGKGSEEALYYNDYYGELYYAYAPIRNSAGKVVAFVGTDIDITPLYDQLERYRIRMLWAVLFAFAVFGVLFYLLVRRFVTDPMKYIVTGSRNVSRGNLQLDLPEDVLGRSRETQLLGETLEKAAGSVTEILRSLRHLMSSIHGGYLGTRAQMEGVRGEYYHIISSVNATLDMVVGHFDALPLGLAFLGEDKELRGGNKAFDDFLEQHGFTEDFSRLFGLLPEEALEEARGKDRGYTGEIVIRDSADDLRHYTLVLLYVQTDGSNGFKDAYYMLMLNDVTVLSRARTEAEEASRAKTEFLSRMSHEIRTPMNAVLGMAQVVRNSGNKEKIDACMEKIEESSEHLVTIINDILDFSRIEAGKLTLNESWFSLEECLNSVTDLFEGGLVKKNISFRLDSKGVINDGIFSDQLRLQQVLINLLSNGIKFTSSGGRIEAVIEETPEGEGCSTYLFSLTDTGIGMNDELISKVFEPFEQADTKVIGHYGGTGLGLPIARSIVNLMGGEFTIDSQLGKGSTFRFTIRVLSQKSLQGKEPEEDIGEGGGPDFRGKRVMIVDDIEINRDILLELLHGMNLEFDTAEDGREAVDKFMASPEFYYDCILMDIQMPVMDGYEATRKIRGSSRADGGEVCIIAITANALKEDALKSLDAGMNRHMGKPIHITELIQTLKEYLG